MANPVKHASTVKQAARPSTRDAVLDAAERLFAASGPANVSLRAIAAEAGVTYGLVHAYFANKDEVFDRVLERYADRWRPQLEGADQRAAFDVLLGPDFETGPYLRLLAWTLLRERADGAPTEIEVHRRHATLDRLPALRPDGDTDAATVATATALALAFGWRFFNSFIRDALHVEMDEAELQDAVREHLHRIAAS
jgi:AcrR family transcriptional regulator